MRAQCEGTQSKHYRDSKNSGKPTSPSPGAAAGKTRDEIRDLYIAELRARGLETPPEPLLGAAIDMLSGDPRAGRGKIWKAVLREFLRG